MGWALGIATYVIVWWVTFFAVLPIGVTSQHEAGDFVEGTDPGAPTVPYLGRKILAATLIALLLWLPINYAYIYFFLGSLN
jgi:predicted secreted protein